MYLSFLGHGYRLSFRGRTWREVEDAGTVVWGRLGEVISYGREGL